MPTIPTAYRYIVLNEAGTAMIEGTRYKVRLLVLDHIIHGWSAEEMKWQHPDLSLPQIYSALAYYCDHEPQMDAETQTETVELEGLRQQIRPSLVQEKLARLKSP